jgi:hypothetical protein
MEIGRETRADWMVCGARVIYHCGELRVTDWLRCRMRVDRRIEMGRGPRTMTTRQLAPNCEVALATLRALLDRCSYPDLDVSIKSEAEEHRARHHLAEGSLQRLEMELGFRKAPPKATKKAVVRRETKNPISKAK